MQKTIILFFTLLSLQVAAQPKSMHFDYDFPNGGLQTGRSFKDICIYQQPQDVVACKGSNVSFSVGATGAQSNGIVTYKWKKTSVDGTVTTLAANSSVLTVVATEAASYSCDVTNSTDKPETRTTKSAKLSLYPTPTISVQPYSTTACVGSSATFSVGVSAGTFPVSYQWYKNGILQQGQYYSTYTVGSVSTADNYTPVYVVVSGCSTSTSSTAYLYVDLPSVGGYVSGPLTVSQYTTAQYSLSGNVGNILQWETIGNWSTITQSSSNPISLPIYFSAGSYNCRALVKNGVCPSVYSNNLAITVVSSTPKSLAIDQQATTNLDVPEGLLIFPNPSTGSFSVSLGCEAEGEGSLEIRDAMTRIVKTESIHKTAYSLYESYHFSDLKSGMYFIEINLPNYRKSAKLIIQ